MTKDEKKELFLNIIENWFNDKTHQINHDNCIEFYNYFLDCLDFEIKFSIEYEYGFHSFLKTIDDLLTNFPFYADYDIHNKKALKSLILNSNKTINSEQLNSLMLRLEEFFFMVKEEYII